MGILSLQSLRYSIPALLGSTLLWWLLLSATSAHRAAGGTPMELTFFALFLAPMSVISGSWVLLCCLSCSRLVLFSWSAQSLPDRIWWSAALLLSLVLLVGLWIVF